MAIEIVVDSKHGSTREIGERIAGTLRDRGFDATVYKPAEHSPIGDAQAVIVGSGVYAGSWLPDARNFVASQGDQLRDVPVWLFSSGPIGPSSTKHFMDEQTIDALVAQTGARGHQMFGGKLDSTGLSWLERLVTRLVRAPTGDFRDFEAIDAWANQIADELTAGNPLKTATA